MEKEQWRKPDGTLIMTSIEDEIRSVLVKEQWRKPESAGVGIFGEEESGAVRRKKQGRGHQLKVCVGTDSQVKARVTEFATVIVCLRKGKGGFMYVCGETTIRKMSIRERMLREVAKSIDVAYSLSRLFTLYDVDLEVHADINTNPNFKSNDALKEAMGYILGMGFTFKAKPDAFASSACANKMVQ